MKSGFTAIIGRPNVGKSTLLNCILGQKIVITTDKAQTTRKRIKGIYTTEQGQIVFVDTPGVHKPLNKLGEFLLDEAKVAVPDADLILFLVDGSEPAGKGDKWIAENILKTYNNSRPDLEILLNIEKVQYFLDTKEFNEALNLLKKNKKLIYKYGQKYQKTNIIQQFIDCYKDQKNLFKFNLYARKMNNFYNSLPSDSLLFLTLAEKQIDLYRTIGKIEEANKYAQNALNKLEPVKEYVPKLYGKFLRKAAEIKLQEENTAEAQIYLEQAIESYKKTIPEESFEFYEIYQSYGNLSNTN